MSVTIDPRRHDAVLFDLDGVVTDTAVVHAAAWRRLFDGFLAQRPAHGGENHAPFTDADYRRYIDGKPRADGVRDFLAARGVTLPPGHPDDTAEDTVCGLANRKQQLFLKALADGVRAFESTITLAHRLRSTGVPVAVYSASRNCRDVLRAAGVDDVFGVRVDGIDAQELGLPGKPHPAMLLETARRLGADPARCVVIEDAEAGVTAGRRGGFGLVIGVDRTGPGDALRACGADAVVRDAVDIDFDDTWFVTFDGYQTDDERLREALCTVGNGYFATRGCAPEAFAVSAHSPHYPGTYCAGVSNRLEDTVDGVGIDNESMVNLPNWLVLTFRIDGGPWFDIDAADVLEYRQRVDLRCAEVVREMRVRDAQGRVTRVVQRRFAAMHDPHVAALQTTLTAENYSGTVELRSAVDAGVRNCGVRRYLGLSDVHLEIVEAAEIADDAVVVTARTVQSGIRVAVGMRTTLWCGDRPADVRRRPVEAAACVGHDAALPLGRGQSVTVEKTASIFTGRDPAVSEPGVQVRRHLAGVNRYDEERDSHRAAWAQLWDRVDIDLDGNLDEQRVLRFHMMHVMQTLSPHTGDIDAGVPARGLHGEAYRGHIFWDEMFVFPVLNLRMPAITRALLRYRYRRLPEARKAAREAGRRGAMFPWQSGSDGREESQRMHLNPLSGRWNPDASARAHHVGIAVAYGAWQYYQATADLEFLVEHGAELIVDIARFWVSLADFDEGLGRYVIRGVIGPDEFHSGYPDHPHDGVDNNAYTNVMAVWVIARALDALATLPLRDRLALEETLGLDAAELERFDDVSRRMFVPFHDGVISQFEGYDQLRELDWHDYRRRYPDIARLDRILESENDDVNRYKAGKQADVLMLFYLLSADELRELFDRMNYPFEPQQIPRTIDYYLARTSHGSTLSALVHSWVLARGHRDQATQFFEDVLRSDINDIQGGTTAEGIHLAAMAGSIDLVQRCFTGLEIRSDRLVFSPRWPEELGVLRFPIQFRGHRLHVRVSGRMVEVQSDHGAAAPVTVESRGRLHRLLPGATVRFNHG